MGKSELVDVTVQILGETEKAFQITEGLTGKDKQLVKHWIPKSQVELEEIETGQLVRTVVLTMPRWLFEEKGLTSDA